MLIKSYQKKKYLKKEREQNVTNQYQSLTVTKFLQTVKAVGLKIRLGYPWVFSFGVEKGKKMRQSGV